MANLQIKGMDDDLYAQIKRLATAENRSISQQIVYLTKEYLSKKRNIQSAKTPARTLLDLSGSWDDDRTSEDIINEIKSARHRKERLKEGF